MKGGEKLLVKPQEVEVGWNPTTRKWYEDLGYKYTKNNEKFMIPVDHLYPNSETKVRVICDFCGDEILKSYRRCSSIKNDKDACYHCNSAKRAWKELSERREVQMKKFFDKCSKLNLIPISTVEDYKNVASRMKYHCNKHGDGETSYGDFMASLCGCKQCGIEHGAITSRTTIADVINIVESKNSNNLLNPEDYCGVNVSNLRIICGSCGNEFTTSLASINASQGHCYDCGSKKSQGHNKLSPDEVERRINSINGNALLNKDEYVKNNVLNLNIKCSCGNTYTTSLANYEYFNVNRCPVCTQRTSQGELLISSILDELQILYDTEHKFEDCRAKRPLPFDFYLPDYNAIVEFDGPHHYRPIFSKEQFLRTKRHDAIKNKYCETHGIKLIRIPYWDRQNIRTIIIQGLGLELEKTA